MGRGQRLGLILSAVVFAAIAFIVLRPDDEDDSQPAGDTAAQTDTQAQRPEAEAPPPEPEPPEFETIRIRGGEVQGGQRRITAAKGETVRIEVRSDAPDEIHLHGYDVTKQVAPNDPARFRVKAGIEGVFEIEAHDLGHVIIGELVVEP